MRPDQHKKKKNAEYKKKHGISKPEKKPVHGAERKAEGTESKPDKARTQGAVGGLDQVDVNYGRKFAKRKVHSNWDRYEDLDHQGNSSDDNNSLTQRGSRGEDFSLLLQKNVNPVSQFCFEDEKEWSTINHGNDKDQEDSLDVFSIDTAALAASLQALPLYLRVGIPQEEFTEEMIATMREESGYTHLSAAEMKENNAGTLFDQASSAERNTDIDHDESTDPSSEQHSEQAMSSRGPSPPYPNTEDTDEVEDGDEDDLELLLSLDTPKSSFLQTNATQPVKQNVKPKVAPEKSTDEDLECWLDEILS